MKMLAVVGYEQGEEEGVEPDALVGWESDQRGQRSLLTHDERVQVGIAAWQRRRLVQSRTW